MTRSPSQASSSERTRCLRPSAAFDCPAGARVLDRPCHLAGAWSRCNFTSSRSPHNPSRSSKILRSHLYGAAFPSISHLYATDVCSYRAFLQWQAGPKQCRAAFEGDRSVGEAEIHSAYRPYVGRNIVTNTRQNGCPKLLGQDRRESVGVVLQISLRPLPETCTLFLFNW